MFRRTHRVWHRRARRVSIVACLVVIGSALWLTLFYDPHPGTGPLLFVLRLLFLGLMTFSLVRGVTAVRERDDLAKGAGWVINLLIAEWLIRRPSLATVTPRPV